MKKHYFLTFLFTLGICLSMYAQKSQKSITNYEKGQYKEFSTNQGDMPKSVSSVKEAGLNWEMDEPASIGQSVKVSNTAQNTVASWWTNDQRFSVYGTSNTPLWEVTCPGWDPIFDMTDDGSKIIAGYNNIAQVYNSSSVLPDWEVGFSNIVKGVRISDDGQKVFIGTFNAETQDSSFVYCYNVGDANPLWKKAFPGNFTALTSSKSGNRAVMCVYGGVNNKLWILDGNNGSTLYEAPYKEQASPAISYDGKYVVNGDYNGYAYLYEYNENTTTYSEKWNFKVDGSSCWVTAMGISSDGSTIAIGSLVFLSNGDYDGYLYVFNNYSPVPVWTAQGFGDEVSSVDLSSNGSIIAAGSWGKQDNSIPDLFLYRKQSSEPYFTINTPGSIFGVDISDDGKYCSTTGKATHARLMGYGGVLYNVNANPGGGILSGHAIKDGTEDQAGVKVEVTGLTDYFAYTDDASAYSISYIPEGTYTVKYSAVGYIPQEISNIQITEGQTTTSDVTLESVGNPPTNLIASQAAGLTVNLFWQASTSTNIEGYNIYRKQYLQDRYPETPLITVGADQLTFTDNTALPVSHYYYVVTAQLSGELQSPYSNEAEGWISTGYITNEISAYIGSTPTIDGVINPDEWSDAFKVDISDFQGKKDNVVNPVGSVTAWFKVNPEKTALYVAVDDINDTVLEDHDEVALYVDDNNDGTYPPTGDDSEGNFWAVHYAAGDIIKYRPLYNTGGTGTIDTIPNGQISVSIATGHLVYEFVIPLGNTENWEIAYDEQSQSKLFAFVLDDPSSYDSYWPYDNLNVFDPAGYGQITFGNEDLVPPAPQNLELINEAPSLDITLEWQQADINDFDHYNIYMSNDNGLTYSLLNSCIGTQFCYTLGDNITYKFYVTTVDHGNNESESSNIVELEITGINPVSDGNLTNLNLGPNPFSQLINIDFNVSNKTHLQANIFDINGKCINTLYDANIQTGNCHLSWNGKSASGKSMSPGVYTIRFVTSNSTIKSSKIILIK